MPFHFVRFLSLRLVILIAVLTSTTIGALSAQEPAEPTWQAGVSRRVITPPQYIWMSGYGNRSAPAEGKIHDLYVRVACLQPAEETAPYLFISLDLVGVPVKMSTKLSQEFADQYQTPRENVMFTCSHTHCGPALDEKLSYMLAMDDKDWDQVREYQTFLNEQIRQAVKAAIDDRRPATLSFGNGKCGFASNRRPPFGEAPVDHDVPVLKIAGTDGTVRGIIFGYACHNTTLGIQKWCGDYAGFAQLNLEDTYPDSVAMFFTGCGADQNPMPRRTIELCEMYGRMLSVAVQGVVNGTTKPLPSSFEARFKTIPLEFAQAPTRAEIEQKLAAGSRYEKSWAKNMLADLEDDGQLEMVYDYPVQVWKLGGTLTWIALGGEVVVDYSVRLKSELGKGTTWVTGYANDVMCYIPSERVLKEGGYEGATAMLYYQKPSPWKAGIEEKIVNAVHELAEQSQASQ